MAFMSKESFSELSDRKHREYMAEFGSPKYRGEPEETVVSSNIEYMVAVEIPGLIDDLRLEIDSLKREVESLKKNNQELKQGFIRLDHTQNCIMNQPQQQSNQNEHSLLTEIDEMLKEYYPD